MSRPRTCSSTARASTNGGSSRWASAGRSPACQASETSNGTACSVRCGGPAMTATSSSSTRTATSRRPTTSSNAGSSWPVTSSARTSSELMTLSIDDLTYTDVAKTIDHSLLRPELDDAFVEAGCRLAAEYDVASVCVRPADVVRAAAILADSSVAVGTTIGFPHGNHRTETKVFEARRALADGAFELDMVLQIGALKSGRDADVHDDIAAVVEVAHAAGAIVKVIFENAYLTDDEKVRACHITEAAGGDFVKTSTGFAPSGATHDDLRLMRANTSPHVRVKAAGGVRTLDALLEVMALGVTRIGATATESIIQDFRARKAGDAPTVGATADSSAY